MQTIYPILDVLPKGTIAEEPMQDEDNGYRPPGVFHLSDTAITSSSSYLQDWGSTEGNGSMTHALTLYRHSSGSLVFGANTYTWSWGLSTNHDLSGDSSSSVDVNMQQATINLLADMNVQPSTLQSNLLLASPSTDTIPPTSVIGALPFAPFVGGVMTISGTSVDVGGGVVGGVEISTDNGTTWHPATGRGQFSYAWTPTLAGTTFLCSRAVDDSGNIEIPTNCLNVNVSGTSQWSIWPLKGGPGIPMTSVPGYLLLSPQHHNR